MSESYDWEIPEDELDADIDSVIDAKTAYEFEPWKIILDALKAGYYNRSGDRPPTHATVAKLKKIMHFMKVYCASGRRSVAAEASGFEQGHFSTALHQDPNVAKAFAFCDELVGDMAEDEARRRGIHGFTEKVTKMGPNGTEITTRNKVSDRLLAMVLQGAKPHKYNQRQQTDINISQQIGIAVITSGQFKSADEWEKGAQSQPKFIDVTPEKVVDVSVERVQTVPITRK